ncbi:MAG TPA: metallophosphoesterase family protein [Thermoanaerobaculia bacterium]|nr:metallophosphoesterase family protein [Thermoanaerobaculia bacterium]
MGEEGKRLGGVTRIGIIADTHGVLHPGVLEVFANVDHIVHAGDVGGEHVLRALGELAPVTFVRGNNDDDDGLAIVRKTIGGMRLLITHILPRPRKLRAEVAASLRRTPADVVVFGHSHLPHNELIGGVRFFNPASAGPRRFDYPTSIGILEAARAMHVALDERSAAALAKRMNQL